MGRVGALFSLDDDREPLPAHPTSNMLALGRTQLAHFPQLLAAWLQYARTGFVGCRFSTHCTLLTPTRPSRHLHWPMEILLDLHPTCFHGPLALYAIEG